jgi:hypothetical protein
MSRNPSGGPSPSGDHHRYDDADTDHRQPWSDCAEAMSRGVLDNPIRADRR